MDRKKITEDPWIEKMFIRKGLRENTKQTYYVAFIQYCELTNKTPTQLRKEAVKEQKEIDDIFDRHVTDYLMEYYVTLKKKGLKPMTIKTMLSRIRAFYVEYKIELPDAMVIKEKPRLKKKSEIIHITDVREAVNSTSNSKFKAIITLAASSGMRAGDIRKLTIEDFITSTTDYHDSDNIYEIIPILEKYKVVPCFEFISEKTDNHTITFCTPECVKYTLTYLKTRTEQLENDDPLFATAPHKAYSHRGFAVLFENINDKIWGQEKDTPRRFFRSHALRSFFGTVVSSKGTPYPIYKKMMGQSLSRVDDAYVIVQNKNACKEEYLKVMKYLTTDKIETYDVKSKEYITLESRVEEQARQIKELQEQILYDGKLEGAKQKIESSKGKKSV